MGCSHSEGRASRRAIDRIFTDYLNARDSSNVDVSVANVDSDVNWIH